MPEPTCDPTRHTVLDAIRSGATNIDTLAERLGVNHTNATLRNLLARLERAGWITATGGARTAVTFTADADGDRRATIAELTWWLLDTPAGSEHDHMAWTVAWLRSATVRRVTVAELPLYLGYQVMQGTDAETIVGVRHTHGGDRAEVAVADVDRVVRIAFTTREPLTVYGPPALLAWLGQGDGTTWKAHGQDDRIKMLVSTGTVNAARADTDTPRQDLHLLLPAGPILIDHDAADLAIAAAQTADTIVTTALPFQARLVGPNGTVGEPFGSYHVTDADLLAGVAGAGKTRPHLDGPAADGIEDTRLVWVFPDDRVGTGTVQELAHTVEHAQLAGDAGPAHVYCAGNGELVEVDVRVESSGYGEDDFATVLLHVMLPDGVVITGSWRADGRT